jgi:hypothetical protein
MLCSKFFSDVGWDLIESQAVPQPQQGIRVLIIPLILFCFSLIPLLEG